MDMKLIRRCAMLGVVLFATTACGSTLVRGQSPFVSVSALSWSGDTIETTVNIRNINDVAMDIDTLTVTLNARDAVLLQRSGPMRLSIDPNTTEDITLAHTAGTREQNQLGALQSGDSDSLPFTVEGRVHTAEDGDLNFRHQGYLFRVPGRPGQFRATSTRSPEDR